MSKPFIIPGQCLVCGPFGAYYRSNNHKTVCTRCNGDGQDPKKTSAWYQESVLPEQLNSRSIDTLF